MRWAGHAAYVGEMRIRTKFWLVDVKERDHSKNIGVDGRILLEWILGK
jgi:hypothetical protein